MKKINRDLLDQLKMTQETSGMPTRYDMEKIEDSLWDCDVSGENRGSSMERSGRPELNTMTTNLADNSPLLPTGANMMFQSA